MLCFPAIQQRAGQLDLQEISPLGFGHELMVLHTTSCTLSADLFAVKGETIPHHPLFGFNHYFFAQIPDILTPGSSEEAIYLLPR